MTSNPHRMKENLGSIEFIMDKKDLDVIDSLNKNQRYGQSGNWNVYDNPKESRFTKLFKELEVEDNKNDIYQINADTEQYQGETNSAFDNISRDPSEENSRDSRASYENFNIITEETLKDTIKEEKKEKKDDKELEKNKIKEKNEIKEIKENKEEELNLTLEINDIISQKDKRSTIMIKNIPNKFNQEYILNIINQNFKGTFDVFVLPTDINKFKNFGYAFINFTSSYYIPYFYFMFNGNMWFGTNSQKICELAYSKVQGKEALLDHYPSKIVFCNEEALEVTPEQKYIIPNIYKLYFNECFPKEKIEEYKYYFITKMPSL